MKVDVVSVSDIEKRMTVGIPAEKVTSSIDQAYSELKKTVKLRGFRPGKAPISILEKHFKAQVEEDVVNKLVQETYPKALEEVKASPVSQPKIENGGLEKGKDFSYTAVFEIKPAVEVGEYEGLELEKLTVAVPDEELQKELDVLRNSYATMEDVDDRAIQQGDHVTFDFEGIIDGEPYSGGKKTDFFLEIKEDAFLPGFTDNLEGLKKEEEKSFSLTLPDDYFDKDIAGKSIDFKAVIKTIKIKILPELTDDFAKDAGEYKDLEDLKTQTNQRLFDQKAGQADNQLREKIFDQLIENNPFEVPKSMIEQQSRNMVQNMQQMFQAQGMDLSALGQTPEQLVEQYREPAERQVRSALLLEAVAEKAGLEVGDEDYEAKYQEFAAQVGQDVSAVKEKVEKEMLRPQILEGKALELIKEKAKITET
ncbi:MAG: trigger factor [Deltaproteobacteria bacterium]|nr:trigger factor [Deltaproteobacteria bacterium]